MREHPYSLVMRVRDTVHVSGAAGIDYATHVAYGDPREAVHGCYAEVLRRLATVGAGPQNIVKLTYHLADLAHRQVVNEQYEETFTAPAPARTVVGASELPYGALVVIDCVAELGWDRAVDAITEVGPAQEATVTTQLRTYTTLPGKLDDWTRLFQEKIRPLRTSRGFRIDGAWTVPERDQFLWIVSVDGTVADFERMESEYYADDAHVPLDAEAKNYLAKGETVFLTEL
ncbi:RidA family protein [Pseudonocardia sp. NPDC049635]|uniref:RidA family protein n=1 Tax=Pseudonocardia sp. NPDC049635 TaxID=3155506 RepID=UPI0033FEBFED